MDHDRRIYGPDQAFISFAYACAVAQQGLWRYTLLFFMHFLGGSTLTTPKLLRSFGDIFLRTTLLFLLRLVT